MKALIEPSGRVAQVVANNKIFPVAPPLRWVDAPTGVKADHAYDGSKFIAPVHEPTPQPGPDPTIELDAAITAAFSKIRASTTLDDQTKAGFDDLEAALLGKSGRNGRIAGRKL